MGPQVCHFLHELLICFDYFLGDVELQLGNQILTQGLNVQVEPLLLRSVQALVQE